MPLKAAETLTLQGASRTTAARSIALTAELKEWLDDCLVPLPGTLCEAEFLQKQAKGWGLVADCRIGSAARESVLHEGPPPFILHMATHGLFLTDPAALAIPVATHAAEPAELSTQEGTPALPRLPALLAHLAPGILQPRNPMQRSLLALAGARTGFEAWTHGGSLMADDDGVLTAQEIAELNLRGTWLVVLSACDTGIGVAQGGEGVLGLRRGFHLAGARYLVMTLWPVPDEDTVAFIENFYNEALRTQNPPRALADAQRDRLLKIREERGLWEAVRSAGAFLLNY